MPNSPLPAKDSLADPLTAHLRRDFVAIRPGQSVEQALAFVRANPPTSRVIYFYVVGDDGRLCGVVPTRRLLISPAGALIADLMIRKLVTLSARASVLDACEYFIQHRLLSFPVVDDAGRILGVVDTELYTDQVGRLDEQAPLRRWLRPLTHFLHIEAASGVILLVCTVVALVLANSPWSAVVHAFWETHFAVAAGPIRFDLSLHHWINDGLMALFFFVVGLEIKREMVCGELSEPKKALLPIVAALGGMVAPALVYLLFHAGRPTVVGWGIPMATDIAFVVGFLALLGPRVPHSLKILLLALAIVDDIGATLVIAVAYTTDLSLPMLAVGLGGFGVVALLRWSGVRSTFIYFMVGAAIWSAFLHSGVHPTVAGVALGLATPARPWLGDRVPLDIVGDFLGRLGGAGGRESLPLRGELISPAERLERLLHPWVAFGVMPVFALANAGVHIEGSALGSRVGLGVGLGLLIGKPLGIALFSWAAARLGLARMPAEINLKILIGAGCLAGIGFTMALFIASLALKTPPNSDEAKLGILLGSTLSAGIGFFLLWRYLPSLKQD